MNPAYISCLLIFLHLYPQIETLDSNNKIEISENNINPNAIQKEATLQIEFDLVLSLDFYINGNDYFDEESNGRYTTSVNFYLSNDTSIDEAISSSVIKTLVIWMPNCDVSIASSQELVNITRKYFYMDHICEIELRNVKLPFKLTYSQPLLYNFQEYFTSFHFTNTLQSWFNKRLFHFNEIKASFPNFMYVIKDDVIKDAFLKKSKMEIRSQGETIVSEVTNPVGSPASIKGTSDSVKEITIRNCDPAPNTVKNSSVLMCLNPDLESNFSSSSVSLSVFSTFPRDIQPKCKFLASKFKKLLYFDDTTYFQSKYHFFVIIYQVVKICVIFFSFMLAIFCLKNSDANTGVFKVICIALSLCFYIAFFVSFNNILNTMEFTACLFSDRSLKDSQRFPIEVIASLYTAVYIFVHMLPFQYIGDLIEKKLEFSENHDKKLDIESRARVATFLSFFEKLIDMYVKFSVNCMSVILWGIMGLNLIIGFYLMIFFDSFYIAPGLQFCFLSILIYLYTISADMQN